MTSKNSKIILTVDMVTLAVHADGLKILLIKRKGEVEHGKWALPGGRVHTSKGEIPDAAAARELQEETGIDASKCYMEELGAFAGANRDPRGYTISVTYLCIVQNDATEVEAGSDASEIDWYHIYKPKSKSDLWIGNVKLAFDHQKILERGLDRLNKNIGSKKQFQFTFLPEEFTQSGLVDVFSYIKQRTYSRQAFSKKVEKMVGLGNIIFTGKTLRIGQGRPKNFYRVSESYINEIEEG